MKKIILLNWEYDNLYGWEKLKIDRDIDFLAEKVMRGFRFDVLNVYQTGFNEYELVSEKNNFLGKIDGGHKRAAAHYIANRPLRCFVRGYRNRKKSVNIKDIVIEDGDRLIGDKRIMRTQLEQIDF